MTDHNNLIQAIRENDLTNIIKYLSKDIIIDHNVFNPLITAIDRSNIDFLTFAYILNAGANPNHKCFGGTPFEFAIRNKNIKVVELFINYGVDVNVSDECGVTLLYTALQETYNYNIIELLLNAGADDPKKEKLLQLFIDEIVKEGDQKLFCALFRKYGSIITPNIDDDGLYNRKYDIQCELFCAIKQHDHKQVELLCQRGANPNKGRIVDTYTFKNVFLLPLMYAWYYVDTLEVIEVLLRYGAKVNINKKYFPRLDSIADCAPPLLIAAVNGMDAPAVQIFLEYGADVNVKDCNGYTALDTNRKNMIGGVDPKIQQLLLAYGAKAAVPNANTLPGEVQQYSNFRQKLLNNARKESEGLRIEKNIIGVIFALIAAGTPIIAMVITSLVFMLPIGLLYAMFKGVLWIFGI
jgi:ankyrin repeat protein